MAVEYDPNGTPILTNDSLISDVPPYTQAMAAASLMPVGAIIPYMGTTTPDFWLACDGSRYNPDDLPELYAANGDFHDSEFPGEFRVPDLRARLLMGAGGGAHHGTDKSTSDVNIVPGQRSGHQRPPIHYHSIAVGNPAAPSGNKYVTVQGDAAVGGAAVWTYQNHSAIGVTYSSPLSENFPPFTGVAFIVYAGRSTAGITPIADMAPVTTRQMIETRLAEAGIGEEEIKMLKEQLATLKEQDAK